MNMKCSGVIRNRRTLASLNKPRSLQPKEGTLLLHGCCFGMKTLMQTRKPFFANYGTKHSPQHTQTQQSSLTTYTKNKTVQGLKSGTLGTDEGWKQTQTQMMREHFPPKSRDGTRTVASKFILHLQGHGFSQVGNEKDYESSWRCESGRITSNISRRMS